MNRFNVAWVISLIALISLGGYLYYYNPTPIPLKISLNKLPAIIGDWKWERNELLKDSYGVQGADEEVMKVYRNSSGKEIKLYIGYFETQKQGKEIVYHRSRWLHKKAGVIEIPMNPHGLIRINKTIFKDRINSQLLLFWYDVNGRIIIGPYKAKIFTIFNALFRSRTNGAIIIISQDIRDPKYIEGIAEAEVEFAQNLLSILRHYLPAS